MNFKRISCFILTAVLLLGACACGKNDIIILPAAYDSTTQYEFAGEAATKGDYTLSFDKKLGFPILSGKGFDKRWDSSLGSNMAASSLFVKLYDPTYGLA